MVITGIAAKTLAVTTLVGIAHIICGITVYFAPVAFRVTPLSGLYDFSQWIGIGSQGGAFILLLVGILAVLARNFNYLACIVLLLPQQGLLLFQIYSISAVLVTGHYPDGYLPLGGSWFILADQIWPWLLTVSHSAWLAAFIYQGLISTKV